MFGVAPRAVVVDASAGVDVVGGVSPWPERMEAWVIEDTILLAPPSFRFEMANAMLLGQRLEPQVIRSRIRALDRLRIELSEVPSDEILECVQLAMRHRLTVHDAAYLQLAIFLEADLATQDKALARAARAEGLVVHD